MWGEKRHQLSTKKAGYYKKHIKERKISKLYENKIIMKNIIMKLIVKTL